MSKRRKTPRTTALYREVFQAGPNDSRTVRIAAYPPKQDQVTGVTIGIGYSDPETFAKIYFELTTELWKEIQAAVKKALAISNNEMAREIIEELGVKPSRPSSSAATPPPKVTATRKRKTPNPTPDPTAQQ